MRWGVYVYKKGCVYKDGMFWFLFMEWDVWFFWVKISFEIKEEEEIVLDLYNKDMFYE